MKNNVTDNNKHIKRMDQKYDLVQNQIDFIHGQLQVKLDKLDAELEENKKEQKKFFTISAKRNELYLQLQEQMHKHEHETAEKLGKFRKEVNDKLIAQDARLKVTSQYKDALHTQVEAYRAQMTEKWEKCTEEILEKLEVSETRMQDIEVQHLKVQEFAKKFTEFQVKVENVTRQLDAGKELPRVIERSLPILMHFHVCEGLKATIGDIYPRKLQRFEVEKLNQIMDFHQQYSATEPNLKALSSRLRITGSYLKRAGKGMQPFVYGRDFNPSMKNDEANTLDGGQRF